MKVSVKFGSKEMECFLAKLQDNDVDFTIVNSGELMDPDFKGKCIITCPENQKDKFRQVAKDIKDYFSKEKAV